MSPIFLKYWVFFISHVFGRWCEYLHSFVTKVLCEFTILWKIAWFNSKMTISITSLVCFCASTTYGHNKGHVVVPNKVFSQSIWNTLLGHFYGFDVNIKSESDSVTFDHVNKSFAIPHGHFMDQIGEIQLHCVSPRGAIFATGNVRYVIATRSGWISAWFGEISKPRR